MHAFDLSYERQVGCSNTKPGLFQTGTVLLDGVKAKTHFPNFESLKVVHLYLETP